MGRGYIVEDAVEGYLSKLCSQHGAPVTGLLIGQSTVQRDFVVLAARTPLMEESAGAGKSVDKEWVSEHARQVSRMLPGGLSVLGVFIISDSEAKDTLTTLRQLVFAVESLVSSERLWTPADDDVSDSVTLHVNPKTRKTVCRTFDVKDPKSVAKPADWKYQTSLSSSWVSISCWLTVDLLLPLPDAKTQSLDSCLKEALRGWAQQVEAGVCLIDGKKLPEDVELAAGQKRNVKQMYTAQILTTPGVQRCADVGPCGGWVSVRGGVHSRALLQSRARARLAERLLKRDVVSTVACRVQMLLEELLPSEEGGGGETRDRAFEPPPACPVSGESRRSRVRVRLPVWRGGLSEVAGRLKEMLDIDVAEDDLDTKQEVAAETEDGGAPSGRSEYEPAEEAGEAPEPQRNTYIGVAMATAGALLAAAASVLYLSDV
ncbi:LOW QUALITY PROTEIN: protein odr-4 homolog [Menidia menidia]